MCQGGNENARIFFFHISQLGQKHYGVALESLNDLQIWPPLETNFLAIWVWEIFGPANFHKDQRVKYLYYIIYVLQYHLESNLIILRKLNKALVLTGQRIYLVKKNLKTKAVIKNDIR